MSVSQRREARFVPQAGNLAGNAPRRFFADHRLGGGATGQRWGWRGSPDEKLEVNTRGQERLSAMEFESKR